MKAFSAIFLYCWKKTEAKSRALLGRASKLSLGFQVTMKRDYIDQFAIADDHRTRKTAANLTSGLNRCGLISLDLMCN